MKSKLKEKEVSVFVIMNNSIISNGLYDHLLIK